MFISVASVDLNRSVVLNVPKILPILYLLPRPGFVVVPTGVSTIVPYAWTTPRALYC